MCYFPDPNVAATWERWAVRHNRFAVDRSSVDLSQNNIQRPNNRNHVRDQMSEAKFLKRLQVHEARRAHTHPPGLLRAVGNQIAANLAFRSFDRMIVIANGRLD